MLTWDARQGTLDKLGWTLASASAEDQLGGLAQEQAVLRHVATLVAEGASPQEVFTVVAEDLAELLGADTMGLLRFEPGGAARVLSTHGTVLPGTRPGERVVFSERSVFAPVWERGEPAMVAIGRHDPDNPMTGLGLRTVAGAPITVDGRVWGMAAGGWRREPAELPPSTADRLAQFCWLIATAIANAESRDELRFLAEEQAALRRIATLVAEGGEPGEIFDAVGREVCGLLGADATRLTRCGPDDARAVVVGGYGDPGDHVPVGGSYSLADQTAIAMVGALSRAVRLDPLQMEQGIVRERLRAMGIRTAVQAPIVVDGKLWGTIGVAWRQDDPLPAQIEDHVARFTDLVATAVASAINREAQRALADQQAALRRVATLVAGGGTPTEVFEAVTREARGLMGVDGSILVRYEPDDRITVMARAVSVESQLAVGDVVTLDGDSATSRVLASGLPARIETYEGISGSLADMQRALGNQASAGAPVVVERRLWGALVVTWSADQSMPVAAEEQLGDFTELIATAIANTESQAALTASRARLVVAADQARRRIQRDLHDGAQQRLVSLALEVRSAQASLRELPTVDPDAVDGILERLVTGLAEAGGELQSIARGLHPAALADGGLDRALRTLARQSAIPVELSVDLTDRLPEPLELAAYFVVSEALTNAAKHASATHVELTASQQAGELILSVRDDGIGGADPARGTGLTGLRDRVEALGGQLQIVSSRGRGTTLTLRLNPQPHSGSAMIGLGAETASTSPVPAPRFRRAH